LHAFGKFAGCSETRNTEVRVNNDLALHYCTVDEYRRSTG